MGYGRITHFLIRGHKLATYTTLGIVRMSNVVQVRYTIATRGLRAHSFACIPRLRLGYTRSLVGYGRVTHSLLLYILYIYTRTPTRLHYPARLRARVTTPETTSPTEAIVTDPTPVVTITPSITVNRLTAEIKFPVVARMRNCFGNYLR